MDNLKVAVGVAKHMETLANKQIITLEAEVKRLRDALEIMLQDAGKSDYETRRKAYAQARTALGTASEYRGDGGSK